MTPWQSHPKPGASLRALLLGWLMGGLLLVALVPAAWHAVWVMREAGLAQDVRLTVALVAGEATSEQMLLSAHSLEGERISGSERLLRHPRAQTLRPGAPQFRISHEGGRLLRVAARIDPTSEAGGGAVLQVAEPLSMRVPSLHDVLGRLHAVGVTTLWCGLVVLAVLVLVVVTRALRWVGAARQAIDRPASSDAVPCVPAELTDLVTRSRALAREQQAWVDQQRRFLADASHQLRTPMAVLRAQLQAALACEKPMSVVLPEMLHTVDRVASLTDQLLSLTRLEQLKRQGQLARVDVREVARTAVMELAPLIAAKRLDFTLADDSFEVAADPTMLGELLRNLIANAIHHAADRGRVGVVLQRVGQGCDLVVWDEGPGIDDMLRPRLFQPFAAGKGGVGLGLSMCRQIAEAMSASVELHNRCDGERVVGVDAVVSWSQPP